FNLFASQMLRQYRADFTEEKLYTISDATRKVLNSLEEPVTLRLYFSRSLAERAPLYADYGARVKALLRHYADLSHGMLKVEVIDPEPFSAEEDRAIAAGLQAIPLGDGQNAYFGLVGENSTDQREVIPFLSAERAEYLEYDLTKLVHKLNTPHRKVVGVITSLPMFGGFTPRGGRRDDWAVVLQMREFYKVIPIEETAKEVPSTVDVLLIVTPAKMNDGLARSVDAFALSGKPVIVYADPWNEAAAIDRNLIGKSALKADDPVAKMLSAWGVKVSTGRIVGDITFARKVIFNNGGREQAASYLVWMELDRRAFVRPEDPVFANVNNMIVGSAGALEKAKDAKTVFEPLVRTSDRAMLMSTDYMAMPNPLELLAAYKPGGKPLVLAARVKGEARSAFAGAKSGEIAKKDAANTQKDAANEKKKSASGSARTGRVNLLVFADADTLSDRFWATRRKISETQTMIIPAAANATFLLNALEQMSGGGALSGLRGRSLKQRPFVRVEEIRRAAERRFRARERELKEKLKEAEKRLSSIKARVEGGKVVISEKDRDLIVQVRSEILGLRRSLRDVQRALVRDIENLGFWLKAVNIAGVALLVALIALVVALARRARARRARRTFREA
ncbi:MAG TPA: ABC transporter, partial [Bryobacterales bacterium]|nr:ABC transporter [Bryobacterales bacterium]